MKLSMSFTRLRPTILFVVLTVGREARAQSASDVPIRFDVPGMNQVHVTRDILYKTVNGASLKLDLYTPRDRRPTDAPVVLVLHGGPFPADSEPGVKSREPNPSLARALAATGMASAIISYRFYGGTMLGAAGDDVEDAVSYLRTHARALGIDSSRVCLLAFSGGAHFFAFAIREQPKYIRCLVGLSPALGLARGGDTLQRVAPLDAIQGTGPLNIPIFLSRAGSDQSQAILEWSATFIEGALRRNAELELHNTSKGLHAFEAEDSEDARRVFAAVFAFLKRYLPRGA